MRKLVSILVLLVLAGITTLFFVGRTPPQSTAGERLVADPQHPAPAPDGILDPGITAEAAREALDPHLQDAVPAAPVALAPERARLSVRVIGQTSRRPLAQARVSLHDKIAIEAEAPGASVDGSDGDLKRVQTTGADGLVAFELPTGRELNLFAMGAVGEAGNVNVAVRSLRAGEQRELVVEVPDVRNAPLFGRILSEEDDAPIAGAHVRVVESRISNRGARAPAVEEVRTNADGRFELQFPDWEHPHLRVEAESYGRRIATTRGAHADPEHPLTIRLSHSATLHVHVLGASGAAMAGARIELSARGEALRYDEAQERGLTDTDIGGLPDENWQCQTAADGFATIVGLPPRVELALVVTGESGGVLRREPTGLRLVAGELRELELRVGAGTRISGRVRDQQNQPVAGAELWLLKAEPPERRRIFAFEGGRAAAKAQCDADGAYVFAEVPAGSWLIGPAAAYGSVESAGPDSIAGVAALVELSGEPALTLDLAVSRGLLIRGTVVAPDGTPVPGAQITAMCDSTESFASAMTGPDGGFLIGPLEFETYVLKATHAGKFAPSDEERTQPGAKGVVLKLKPCATLRGRVVDELTGIGCPAKVVVIPDGVEPAGALRVASATNDGEFHVDGLALGPCTVTASTTDGRFAQVRAEVRAGYEVSAPLLSLAYGGKLRVRYAGEGELPVFAVTWNGAVVLFGQELEAGKTKEMPAPAGKLVLRFRTDPSGSWREIQVDLARGESKEITVTAEK